MRRIGITGGIGSGKSVVSRLLRIMGYSVYDTESCRNYRSALGEIYIITVD